MPFEHIHNYIYLRTLLQNVRSTCSKRELNEKFVTYFWSFIECAVNRAKNTINKVENIIIMFKCSINRNIQRQVYVSYLISSTEASVIRNCRFLNDIYYCSL